MLFLWGPSYGSPVLWPLVLGCCAFLGLPIWVTLFWGAFFWPTFGTGLQEHKGASLTFGSPTLEKHAPLTTRGWCRRLLTGCFHHPSWTFRCWTWHWDIHGLDVSFKAKHRTDATSRQTEGSFGSWLGLRVWQVKQLFVGSRRDPKFPRLDAKGQPLGVAHGYAFPPKKGEC